MARPTNEHHELRRATSLNTAVDDDGDANVVLTITGSHQEPTFRTYYQCNTLGNRRSCILLDRLRWLFSKVIWTSTAAARGLTYERFVLCPRVHLYVDDIDL